MVKVKKKVRYPRTSNLLDWSTALAFLGAGLYLFYHVIPNSNWKQLAGTQTKNTVLGSLENHPGSISIKRNKSHTWEEDPHQSEIYLGDTLKTRVGTGSVLLDQNRRIQIFDETTLSFEKNFRIEAGRIQLHFLKVPSSVQFQVGSHSIRIISTKPSAVVQLQFLGGEFPSLGILSLNSPLTLFLSEPPENVHLESGQSSIFTDRGSRLEVSSVPRLREKKFIPESPHAHASLRPFVPHISSPTQGAHFFSNSNDKEKVTLTWEPLPDSLQPEVEVRRLGDNHYRPSHEDTASGSRLNLTDGTYQWRVRTVNSEGKTSAWSALQTFKIQESIRNAVPIGLTHSPQEEKEEEEEKNRIVSNDSPLPKRSLSSMTQHSTRPISRPIPRHKSSRPKSEEKTETETAKIRYQGIISAAKQRIEDLSTPEKKVKINSKVQVIQLKNNEISLLVKWTSPRPTHPFQITLKKGMQALLPVETSNWEYILTLSEAEVRSDLSIQVVATLSETEKLSSDWTHLEAVLPPARPVRPSADTEYPSTLPIDFNWISQLNLTNFELQISSSISFSNEVKTYPTHLSQSVVPMVKPGTYYWRVRPLFHSLLGEWTPPTRFYVR
jgi:hypothetical protein